MGGPPHRWLTGYGCGPPTPSKEKVKKKQTQHGPRPGVSETPLSIDLPLKTVKYRQRLANQEPKRHRSRISDRMHWLERQLEVMPKRGRRGRAIPTGKGRPKCMPAAGDTVRPKEGRKQYFCCAAYTLSTYKNQRWAVMVPVATTRKASIDRKELCIFGYNDLF